MLYQLEQGPTEQEIIRQCIMHKMPLPDAIANAPTLELGLDLYLKAFIELSTCRTFGMAEGPIPWNYIKDWGLFNSLDEDQLEDLFYHIRRMDAEYLKFKDKKAQAKKHK